MAAVRPAAVPAAVSRAKLDLELLPLGALTRVEQRREARVGLREEGLPRLAPLRGTRRGRPALPLGARQHLDEQLLRCAALRLAQAQTLRHARELLLPVREALGGRASRGVLGTLSVAVTTWALAVLGVTPCGRVLRRGDDRCSHERERERQRSERGPGSLLHHVSRHGSFLPAGTAGCHARSTWKLRDASYESPNAPPPVAARVACPHDLTPYVRTMGCSFAHRATHALLASLLALAASACSHGAANAAPERPTHAHAPLPARPHGRASAAFWQTWGDGLAELSGYRATVMRYGAPREAEIVLVYVTEPLDRDTLIKDDAAGARGVPVMKLNYSERFQTGIYPYSLLTSVFAPVDAYLPTRFAPVKITLSAQEWCGHVFHGVWPDALGYESQLISYFASEGERTEHVDAPADTLYEDALFIQLRELDGPFANGGAWRGLLVPRLWSTRRAHVPLRPVQADIARAHLTPEVDRFTLTYEGVTRTFDVEQRGARRILAWTASDGERATLLRTERLPYWQLNGPGDEQHRESLGLPRAPGAALPTP